MLSAEVLNSVYQNLKVVSEIFNQMLSINFCV